MSWLCHTTIQSHAFQHDNRHTSNVKVPKKTYIIPNKNKKNDTHARGTIFACKLVNDRG